MQEVGASDDEEDVSVVVDFSSKDMNDVIFDCEGEGDLRVLLGFCGEDGEDWNPRFLVLCGEEEEASKVISSCAGSIKGWIKLGRHLQLFLRRHVLGQDQTRVFHAASDL